MGAIAAYAALHGGRSTTPIPYVPAAKRPIATAVYDPDAFAGPDAAVAFRRVRLAGARFVRISVPWQDVAPAGLAFPTGIHQARPGDPRYRWEELDRQVRLAHADGLTPILVFWGAPDWVQHPVGHLPEHGPSRPSPDSFGAFAHAVAARYSGSFRGLPRVRYFECWNEPNVSLYLYPQHDPKNRPVSPDLYRSLLTSFAAGVRSVHSSNVVIAGALSPFTVENAAVQTVGPLDFLRRLLCVSGGPQPHSTCDTKVSFDILSFHPYTSGPPTRHALNANDLSLGDIGELRPILSAARRLGHLQASGPIQYWITEFSWNTDPPDPTAVPIDLQARWTAEALHWSWLHGVTLLTWLMLRDQPLPDDFQSGLWFSGATWAKDTPKPTLTAFRFPFVAYRRDGGASVWGRSPTSAAGTVVVERRSGGRWLVVARMRANRLGVFRGTVDVPPGTKELRARFGGETSLAFALDPPANENLRVNPFGVSAKKAQIAKGGSGG